MTTSELGFLYQYLNIIQGQQAHSSLGTFRPRLTIQRSPLAEVGPAH